MKKIEIPEIHIKIVLNYLEKLEKLNEKERGVLIKTIDIINNPMFIISEDTPPPSQGEKER